MGGVRLKVGHSNLFAVLLIGSYAHGSQPRWSGRGSSHLYLPPLDLLFELSRLLSPCDQDPGQRHINRDPFL